MIRLLKLTNAQNTILGDNLIRGVSGGERKRVTIGEMIMGFPRVTILGRHWRRGRWWGVREDKGEGMVCAGGSK